MRGSASSACILIFLGFSAPALADPLKWSGIDGTISITFPSGWAQERNFGDALLTVDRGSALAGEPGITCMLSAQMGRLTPGQTAETLNASMLAQAKDPQ